MYTDLRQIILLTIDVFKYKIVSSMESTWSCNNELSEESMVDDERALCTANRSASSSKLVLFESI